MCTSGRRSRREDGSSLRPTARTGAQGPRPHGIVVFGGALFLAGAGIHVYSAALPIYFASLGFNVTLVGLLVGAIGFTEVVAAFVVGPAIDRFGGWAVFALGALCYALASAGYVLTAALPALILLRAVQGVGVAAVLPSAYSFVPGLVRGQGQAVAFASLGAAWNLSMTISPPLGLTVFDRAGPRALWLLAIVAALAGIAVGSRVPAPRSARRPMRLTFRRAWLPLLVVGIMATVQWGVLNAFVPLLARGAGADPSIYFVGTAAGLLLLRVPVGWLTERFESHRLMMLGIAASTSGALLLWSTFGDALLLGAGLLNGLGAALLLIPLLTELNQRSDEQTRGTALSYYSISFAVGQMIGSSGGGILFPSLGFHGLLVVGALSAGAGLFVLRGDPASRYAPTTTVEPAGPG